MRSTRQLMVDCLDKWHKGRFFINPKDHKYLRDCSDEEIWQIFNDYMIGIKGLNITMDVYWRKIFLKTELEVLERILLED